MAASMDVHISASDEEKDEGKTTNLEMNRRNEHSTRVSSQLLYPDNYAQCYREDKLTVVGKANSSLVKGQLKTVDVPQSSVLSRIKSFLPELSMANTKMALNLVSDPDSANKYNIEHLDDGDGVHVEMNLSVIPPDLLGEDDSSSDETLSESESESDSEKSNPENGDPSLKEVKPSLKLHPKSASKCARPGIEIIEEAQPTRKDLTDR